MRSNIAAISVLQTGESLDLQPLRLGSAQLAHLTPAEAHNLKQLLLNRPPTRGPTPLLRITTSCGYARIFVCDNLTLYGDVIAVRKKHTSGLRLPEELAAGLDRYLEYVGRLVDGIATLKERAIETAEAKRAIYDVFAARILPLRFFDDVDRAYFRPEAGWTDCQPRTLWAVHNACTRVARALPLNVQLQATTRLGRLFGLGRSREEPQHLNVTTGVN
jgi:hypothetical protein